MLRRAAIAGLMLVALAGVAASYLFLTDAMAGTGCDVRAIVGWKPSGSIAYYSEAFSHGPNCANAVVTIVVRTSKGVPLWVDAMPASQLMTFQRITTGHRMRAALVEWLDQPGTFKSSADLPAWAQGADAPAAGEFPFYPEADVDRDSYEKTRAAKAPVFCYVQGMESMSCVVLQGGTMSKIGVQSFPG